MTPEEYEAKRQARYERLLAAADKAERDGEALQAQADKMASIIPFGQPIQIGHYSEGRDRRYRDRIHDKMRRGYALHQKAEALRRRAEASKECRVIFSDDPEASEKIEAKLARLEKRQEMMKQANALIRKNDRDGLLAMGFSESSITRLFMPDFMGRVGFANFQLSNNNAEIRRLKARLGDIQAHANDEASEGQIGQVRIVDNVEDNRVQVFFPDKPSEACRSEMKSHGFKWAPSVGAWQRFRGNSVVSIAKNVIVKYYSSAA